MDTRTHTAPEPELRAGTLSYTRPGLRKLFFWLLLGDVVFMLCEQIETRILPVMLKMQDATDTQIALIVSSVQAIVTCLVVPIVSYRSDRMRSRWGRRIPFIFWATPFFFVSMVATPFAPEIAAWALRFAPVAALFGLFDTSPVLSAFFVLAVFYRLTQAIVTPMFFALFRDVVPMSHMGRFLGLFRIFGSLSSFLVTYWLIGMAHSHSRAIFVVAATLNLVGFLAICAMVKEGRYPPADGDTGAGAGGGAARRFARAVKTFAVESYTNKLYLWTFCTRMITAVAVCISSFVIFFPHYELGMPLDTAGKILSAPTAVWIVVAYPIGYLMDRVGAIPVLNCALLTSAIAYLLSFFLVAGPVSFLISSLITGVAYWAMMLAQLQLAQEVFPQARYSQLSAANLLVISLATVLVFTPVIGWTLDTLRTLNLSLTLPGLGVMPIGPYRCTNLIMAVAYLLSWLCLLQVRRLRAQRAVHAESPWAGAAPSSPP